MSRYCSWVANKDTTERCSYSGVAQACPNTCGTCSICEDPSTDLRFKFQKLDGTEIIQSCQWVGRKDTANRCALTSEICRATCQSSTCS
jgi:hypothetical protein